MNIRASKSDLLRAAKVAASCVAGAATPGLSSVRIVATPKDVRIIGVGHALSASVVVAGAAVSESGEVAVSGDALLRTLSAAADDVLIHTEDGKVVVAASRLVTRLLQVDAADLPAFPNRDQEVTLTLGGDDLKAALAFVVCAADKDPNRGLDVVHVEPCEGRIRFVTTDGVRLAYRTIDGDGSRFKGGDIPTTMVHALADLSAGAVTLTWGSRRLWAETPGFVLAASTKVAEFPDYRQVLPDRYNHRARLTRGALAQALTSLVKSLGLNGPAATVVLSFSDAGLTLSARQIDAGDATSDVDCEYDGAPFKIGMSPRYVLDALATMTDETISWDFSGVLSPTRITGDSPDSVHIVMPLRLD